MIRPLFLFVHGWAGTPRLWDGVCAELSAMGVDAGDMVHLSPRHPGESRDPGATGTNVSAADIKAADRSGTLPLGPGFRRDDGEGGGETGDDGECVGGGHRPVIGIGHSLGAAWLLAYGPKLSGFVALNGFTRFASAPDFPAGTPPRLLAQMRRRLLADAPAVLADFHARAGLALPDGLAGAQTLAAGLDLLGSIDVRRAFGVFASPYLALGGTDDAIVPPAHTAACFPNPVMVEGVGHALPQVRPDLCARHIMELAARC